MTILVALFDPLEKNKGEPEQFNKPTEENLSSHIVKSQPEVRKKHFEVIEECDQDCSDHEHEREDSP